MAAVERRPGRARAAARGDDVVDRQPQRARQTVVSGTRARRRAGASPGAAEQGVARAPAAGRLRVPLAAASRRPRQRLAEELRRTPSLAAPRIPVFSNTTGAAVPGRPGGDRGAARASTSSRPVRLRRARSRRCTPPARGSSSRSARATCSAGLVGRRSSATARTSRVAGRPAGPPGLTQLLHASAGAGRGGRARRTSSACSEGRSAGTGARDAADAPRRGWSTPPAPGPPRTGRSRPRPRRPCAWRSPAPPRPEIQNPSNKERCLCPHHPSARERRGRRRRRR